MRDKNTWEESLKRKKNREEEAKKRGKNKPRRRRRSSEEGRNKGEDGQQQSIQILIHQKLLNTIETRFK
jgi:hypothetical protein